MNRQCIHVGAKRHGRTVSVFKLRDDPRASDRFSDRKPCFFHFPRRHLGRTDLSKAKLRVLVEVPSNLYETRSERTSMIE